MNRLRLQSLLVLTSLACATAAGIGADRVAPVVAAQAAPVSSPIPEVVRPVVAIQPTQRHRHIWMEVTAYCPCQKCCGPNAVGLTASGKPVTHNAGRFVAADTTVLPFGSQLQIPGYHGSTAVPVLDRGGAIKGNKLDVYFPNHDEALQWGRQWLLVTIVSD